MFAQGSSENAGPQLQLHEDQPALSTVPTRERVPASAAPSIAIQIATDTHPAESATTDALAHDDTDGHSNGQPSGAGPLAVASNSETGVTSTSSTAPLVPVSSTGSVHSHTRAARPTSILPPPQQQQQLLQPHQHQHQHPTRKTSVFQHLAALTHLGAHKASTASMHHADDSHGAGAADGQSSPGAQRASSPDQTKHAQSAVRRVHDGTSADDLRRMLPADAETAAVLVGALPVDPELGDLLMAAKPSPSNAANSKLEHLIESFERCLEMPWCAFIRLKHSVVLDEISPGHIPTRFVFVLLVPTPSQLSPSATLENIKAFQRVLSYCPDLDFYEIGRTASTLLANKVSACLPYFNL